MIVLAVPPKKIHPKVIDGSMESDALNRLETLRVQKTTEDVDPRWDKLKSLIIDKKT